MVYSKIIFQQHALQNGTSHVTAKSIAITAGDCSSQLNQTVRVKIISDNSCSSSSSSNSTSDE